MPCFISFTPHLQRHQSFYRRPGHRKKGHGEAVGWRRTEKPGSWMGSPFGLIRLGVIIKRLFAFGKLCFFKSSQHMLIFFWQLRSDGFRGNIWYFCCSTKVELPNGNSNGRRDLPKMRLRQFLAWKTSKASSTSKLLNKKILNHKAKHFHFFSNFQFVSQGIKPSGGPQKWEESWSKSFNLVMFFT